MLDVKHYVFEENFLFIFHLAIESKIVLCYFFFLNLYLSFIFLIKITIINFIYISFYSNNIRLRFIINNFKHY